MQITLRRDDIESVLPLWINPATTNCADISSFGVADPSSMASTTAPANKNSSVAPVAQGANNATNKSDEELERERRRAEWRKKRDEERERRRKELEAMTPEERERPEIINARRRERIAKGSGTTMADVNRLLKQFKDMRKMMKIAAGGKMRMPQMPRGFRR
jgi:hypothetical protein